LAYIHFGLMGIKIGDVIKFIPTGEEFKVNSGNGTPENGGDLIINKKILGEGSYSIRLATKRLLGECFNENADIFEFWEFEGKTLRVMYDEKAGRQSNC
jgi:hypothetical protein